MIRFSPQWDGSNTRTEGRHEAPPPYVLLPFSQEIQHWFGFVFHSASRVKPFCNPFNPTGLDFKKKAKWHLYNLSVKAKATNLILPQTLSLLNPLKAFIIHHVCHKPPPPFCTHSSHKGQCPPKTAMKSDTFSWRMASKQPQNRKKMIKSRLERKPFPL